MDLYALRRGTSWRGWLTRALNVYDLYHAILLFTLNTASMHYYLRERETI